VVCLKISTIKSLTSHFFAAAAAASLAAFSAAAFSAATLFASKYWAFSYAKSRLIGPRGGSNRLVRP